MSALVYGAGLLIGGFIMSIWGGFKRKLITSGFGWGGLGVFVIIFAFLGKGKQMLTERLEAVTL